MSADSDPTDNPDPAPVRSRLQYLEAMGIDLWAPRRAPIVAGDDVEVIETAEIAVTPVAADATITAPAPEPVETPAPEPAAVEPETPVQVAEPAAVAPDSEPPASEPEPEAVPAPVPAADNDPRGEAPLPELQTMVAQCTRCDLSTTRTNTVFGSGNPHADWLFVGEAPGREEDRKGEAFVGRAGQLLDAMLFALELDRDGVYIANVLKCRPPNNRDPMGVEVRECEPFLLRQVELMKPKVIVAMGRFAAQSLLKSESPIGKLRGGNHVYRDIPLVVTYHPAYLLRSPDQKGKVWDDLVMAKNIMAKLQG